MEINKLLNELIVLLDNHEDIKKMEQIKKKINNDTLDLINEYRLYPSIINKKKLYSDEVFLEYVKCESNINYLIMSINNKFTINRGMCCESNKW